MKSNVLIIAGMHRSGTSLMAQWLNKCGLNLGDYLLGSGVGNSKGHFEDMDFYQLHEAILSQNSLNYRVNTNDEIQLSEYHKIRAESIITLKSKLHDQWGWKEPRTCLFLNSIYKELLPQAKYIILYRRYDQVVDSLYRREIALTKKKLLLFSGYFEVLKKNLIKKKIYSNYLETWIRYNLDIISFTKEIKKENFIIVNSNDINDNENNILYYLINWGFDISKYSLKNIYSQKEFNTKNVEIRLSPNKKEDIEYIYNFFETNNRNIKFL